MYSATAKEKNQKKTIETIRYLCIINKTEWKPLCAQWDVAVPKFGQAPSSGCDWLLPNWVTWTSVHARLETFLALALRKLCQISFKNFPLKSLWRSLHISLASLMASSQNYCWQRLYSFCIKKLQAESWELRQIKSFGICWRPPLSFYFWAVCRISISLDLRFITPFAGVSITIT